MKTFFTSDTHLSHDALGLSFRQFETIEHHNDAIMDGINKAVGVHDRLFVLGDFCWRGEESWVAKIRCKNLHLIFGNHDKAKLGKLFKTAEDTSEVKIQGRKVFLSHYPHAFWPASHHGSLHLYGHVHAQHEIPLDVLFPGRRSMDCGVDNAFRLVGEYRPFSEDEIVGMLADRPGHYHVKTYRPDASPLSHHKPA